MLSKKLLFMLGIIIFTVSLIGLMTYKVDEISIHITKSSIQSKMEPVFFIDGRSDKLNIKYEIVDPVVKVSDDGKLLFQSNITLSSGLNQKWGTMEMVTKPIFQGKYNSFYLEPEQVVLKVDGKSSSDGTFTLWREDATPLIGKIKTQMKSFLSTKVIYTLTGKNLRHQAESLSIRESQKHSDGINIVLNVEQSISIIILYAVMFLSIFVFACGYFFVGGKVGFKEAKEIRFRDPRKPMNPS